MRKCRKCFSRFFYDNGLLMNYNLLARCYRRQCGPLTPWNKWNTLNTTIHSSSIVITSCYSVLASVGRLALGVLGWTTNNGPWSPPSPAPSATCDYRHPSIVSCWLLSPTSPPLKWRSRSRQFVLDSSFLHLLWWVSTLSNLWLIFP